MLCRVGANLVFAHSVFAHHGIDMNIPPGVISAVSKQQNWAMYSLYNLKICYIFVPSKIKTGPGMKGRNKQTLSITPRTDAHTAPNRALRPDARPGKHLLTPPYLTFVNVHIITSYLSVCRMRSEGCCVSFLHKNKAIMKKTVFLAADGPRLPASKQIRSNQPCNRRMQSWVKQDTP